MDYNIQVMDIVFITPTIHTGSAASLWPALVQEALSSQDRLFMVAGGLLGSSDPLELRKNEIYAQMQDLNFGKGLVWTSALTSTLSRDGVRLFLQRFAFPLICIGHEYPGYPSVVLDTYGAMQELLDHLLEVHAYRRFLFLRGPQWHAPAADRYLAFNDFIESRGLSWNEQFVSPPTSWTKAGGIVRDMVKSQKIQPGRDFDVLVGSSDLMVYDGILALEEMGFAYPDDFKAAGFNNSPESRLLNPGFTTMHMPFEEAGRLAYRRESIAGTLVLRPSLVVRKSCGCFPHRQSLLVSRRSGQALGGQEALPLSKVLALEGSAFEEGLRAYLGSRFGAWALENRSIDRISSSLKRFLQERETEPFLFALERGMNQEAEGNLPFWQELLSMLRDACTEISPDDTLLSQLFDRARVLFADALERRSAQRSWEENQVSHALYRLDQRLLGLASYQDLSKVLQESLPELGIPLAFLVESSEGEARLLAGFTPAGIALSPEEGERSSSPDPEFKNLGPVREPASEGVRIHNGAASLLPPELMGQMPPASAYFILPLCDESRSYGYLVLGLGEQKAEVYEHIRTSLSGALRSLSLLDQVRHSRDLARRAEEIKSAFLAHASSELLAPLQALGQSLATISSPGQRVGEAGQDINELLRLTQELADFSRAEVEDLELRLRALDLRSCLKVFAADQKLDLIDEDPGCPLPLLDADPERLAQVFRGIFAGLQDSQGELFERGTSSRNTTRIAYRFELEPEGLVLKFRVPAREGQSRIPEGISMTLYRRLIMLHGGSLELDAGPDWALMLRLPYPRFAGLPGPEIGEEGEVLYLAQPPGRDDLASLMPWARVVPMGIEGYEELASGRVRGLIFDPGSAGSQEWGLLRRLRGSSLLRNLQVLVFDGTGMELSASLGQSLFQLLSEQSPGPAIYFHGGTGIPEDFLKDSNLDLLALSERKDLDMLPHETEPRLLVVAKVDMQLLKALRRRWPRVALVLIAEDLSDFVWDDEVEEWLNFICVHEGIFGSDELNRKILDFLEQPTKLAPQTGLLVKKALLYFDRHFTQTLSRWQLADHVHVSEDYLTRIFHKEMGLSPWDYLIRLRIARGSQLLRSTSLSVQEVAQRVGIDDQAYFCRVFRRLKGLTPSRYRNLSRIA